MGQISAFRLHHGGPLQGTPHHSSWFLLTALTPQLWSLASSAEAPTLPYPSPQPPGCGRPQWGLLTAQRPHSATTQQLGQFGEENKHFLPVLGLAARQRPGQLRFLGATGLEGVGGGQELRGAEGRCSPRHPALGERREGMVADPGKTARSPRDLLRAAHTQAHPAQPLCLADCSPVIASWGPCLGPLCFEKRLPCHRVSTHFSELRARC